MKKKSNEIYIGPRVWIKSEKHANGKQYGFLIESTNHLYRPMYFTKAQARKLFEGIKRVVEEALPQRRVNPMLRDGYWRVDTWGSRDRELVMYVNACLSWRRVGVVGREGVLADNVQWFNNSVLEGGARP